MVAETKVRRPLAQALADAEAFRALFPPQCYSRWEIAGSVRRRAAACGDVEHVILPAFGEVDVGGGLFATKEVKNLLFFHLDALVSGVLVAKHLYGASGYRWGEKFRGCDFRGHNQEISCADAGNWGSTLAIKTGPADFSRRLVTGLLRNDRRNYLGRVWECRTCPCVDPRDCGAGCDEKCPRCQGTGLWPIGEIPVPDERKYFALCGVPYAEPWERR